MECCNDTHISGVLRLYASLSRTEEQVVRRYPGLKSVVPALSRPRWGGCPRVMTPNLQERTQARIGVIHQISLAGVLARSSACSAYGIAWMFDPSVMSSMLRFSCTDVQIAIVLEKRLRTQRYPVQCVVIFRIAENEFGVTRHLVRSTGLMLAPTGRFLFAPIMLHIRHGTRN